MSQKNSIGVVTSQSISGNTPRIDPIRQRQIENRERTKKLLDNRRVAGYNDPSVMDFETLFFGDATMAGKTRRAPISRKAFLKVYMQAVAEGKDNEWVGKQFNPPMDKKNVSIKASGLRKWVKENHNKDLPPLVSTRGVENDTEFDSMLEGLDDLSDSTDATDESDE